MDNMKLLMESWRGFLEEPAVSNISQINESNIYILRAGLEEAIFTSPVKEVKTFQQFWDEFDQGLITEEQAFDIFFKSVEYERDHLLLEEGLVDILQKAKELGKKGVNWAKEKISKAWDAMWTFSIKVQLGALNLVGKVMQMARGAGPKIIAVIKRILSTLGAKDATTAQVGMVLAATTVAVLAGIAAAAGLYDTIEAAASAAQYIAEVCAGNLTEQEGLCGQLQGLSSDEVIKVCYEQLGQESQNGALGVLQEMSSSDPEEAVQQITKFTADYREYDESGLVSRELDKMRAVEQLAGASKQSLIDAAEDLIRARDQTLTITKDQLELSLKGGGKVTDIVDMMDRAGTILGEVEKKRIANAMQQYATVKQEAPELASQLATVGEKLKVLTDEIPDLISKRKTIRAASADGGFSKNSYVIKYGSQIVRKYFFKG